MPNDVVPPPVQLLAVGVVAALPMAILGVLPTAILGDIVVHASRAAALYAAKRPREATDLAAVATRAAVSSASGKPHTSGITVSRSSSFAPDVADNIEGIEGMFFAARTFIQKLGTTIGVAVMASLTSYGEFASINPTAPCALLRYHSSAPMDRTIDRIRLEGCHHTSPSSPAS
eukprot:scaffold322527_cov33-Tisochrysis_lutea.AAC.3